MTDEVRWLPPDLPDRMAMAMTAGATFGELREEFSDAIEELRALGFGRPTITHEAAEDAARWPLPRWASTHAPALDLSDPRQLRTARERWRRAREKARIGVCVPCPHPGD